MRHRIVWSVNYIRMITIPLRIAINSFPHNSMLELINSCAGELRREYSYFSGAESSTGIPKYRRTKGSLTT